MKDSCPKERARKFSKNRNFDHFKQKSLSFFNQTRNLDKIVKFDDEKSKLLFFFFQLRKNTKNKIKIIKFQIQWHPFLVHEQINERPIQCICSNISIFLIFDFRETPVPMNQSKNRENYNGAKRRKKFLGSFFVRQKYFSCCVLFSAYLFSAWTNLVHALTNYFFFDFWVVCTNYVCTKVFFNCSSL